MYEVVHYYFVVKEQLDDTINKYAVRVGKGEHQYFDEIDGYIRSDVTRQTYKYQLTPEDRKDMVQDLMVIAFKNCYRYDPDLGHYRHYTNKVAKFEMIKLYYRIRDHNQMSLNKSNYSITFSVEDYQNKNLADPLNIVIYDDIEKHLLNRKGPCTKLERTVYYYYTLGYNARDISCQINTPEKVVRNTLYRVKVKAMKLHRLDV